MRVLGIDAGGTKTIAYLAGADGTIIGEARAGGANLQIQGELEVEKVLHGVIEAALGDRPIRADALCLGIAGVDRADDDRIVRGILRRLGYRTHTVVVNDALVALAAGVGSAPGAVVVAGTGSIAYGVNARGLAARSGGWGYVLGDEGSGYWIGRQALVSVVRESDGRGPRTALTPLVLERFGVGAVPGLVHEIYDRGVHRHVIAALGPLVERARAEGDEVATAILQTAAQELTRAAASVVQQLSMQENTFRIVLAGGMFHVVPSLAADVISRLGTVAPRATAAVLDVEPARGAVHLALEELKGGVRVPPYIGAPTTSPA